MRKRLMYNKEKKQVPVPENAVYINQCDTGGGVVYGYWAVIIKKNGIQYFKQIDGNRVREDKCSFFTLRKNGEYYEKCCLF